MDMLSKARHQINEIDKQIAELYEKRMQAVEMVVQYKKNQNMAILDTKREKEVIERNLKHIQNDVYKKGYQELLEKMMEISRNYQHSILQKMEREDIDMSFIKKKANRVPIEDTVFAIVKKAKEAKAEVGEDQVVDATIGSLYDEEGKLVALQSVFSSYDELKKEVKAAYAASFIGNESYRKQVYDWVVKPSGITLQHEVIATAGGTGAIALTLQEVLDENETLLIPEIGWGSYQLMAQMNCLQVKTYRLFNENTFDIEGFRIVCEEIMQQQKKLCVIINDPCHNPTGYSMSKQEWQQVVTILNECAKQGPVILLNDIAYIDYAYHLQQSRNYMQTFQNISDDVLVVIAFSCSKSLTSYGLRCGAAILLAQKEESIMEVKIVMEKAARATWSNIPNAAMENFTAVTTTYKDAYEKEKAYYIDLLKQRSDIFMNEANTCELAYYPYKEGFFVTVKVEDKALRDRYHEALMKQHIYTVKVNKGIRVAICSLPIEKCKGLAAKMKAIYDMVHIQS